MFVYGFHPVREALRHRPREIERVLVARGRGGERLERIEDLCREAGVAVEPVSRALLDGLANGGSHNGFAAEMKVGVATTTGGDPQLVVLVEDVQDPRNLGALLRVCEGAGVGKVLLRDRGSTRLSPAVARTSAGASEWIPVERVTNSAATIEELQQGGFWVYGTGADGQAPWTVDLTGPLVLAFGGEEKGLRRLTAERCDGLLGLPMAGRVASLNLATAAAAVLYEAVRQRTLAREAAAAGNREEGEEGEEGEETGAAGEAVEAGEAGETTSEAD